MVNCDNVEKIVEILSKERISKYLNDNDSLDVAITRHQWNVQIGEAMKPSLTYFELLLRNRLDNLFSDRYSKNWLINIPSELLLNSEALTKISRCKLDTKIEKGREPLHEDVLSRLSLGFWTSFLHHRYEFVLWRDKCNWQCVFPMLPKRFQKRNWVEPRVKNIKNLRNRIAHLEPVWNTMPSINEIHREALDMIGYMSKDVLTLVTEIDRFEDVYKGKI